MKLRVPHDRAFRRSLAAAAAGTILVAAAASMTGNEDSVPWLVGAAVVAALPLVALTLVRYSRIAELSARVDDVLHGERTIDLDRMDEGELAVLTSELDKMVTRLNLTADELTQERQTLADALADISHQLKTPLTSIALTTELVRRDLAREEGHTHEIEHLRTIAQLERRVERLVSALLKLARLDAGVVHLATQPVDVAALVDDAFEPLAIAFDIADVTFERTIEPGCSFMGDASWSAEALENLLKNCLEHTPAGGTVRVQAHSDVLACRLVVEDTGSGFAEEDLPHVFERFYRGAAAATDTDASEVNPAGVGIGLALARALVEAQGGALTAENAQDGAGRTTGARFRMTFFKDIAV